MNYFDDTFVEELVVRRNGVKNLLLDVLIVLAAIVLISLCFLIPLLRNIFPAMLAIICVAAYLGIRFQGVEFEYAFTNGDFDVDKIMAKRKRKALVAINQKQIRVMAPYMAEYENETKAYSVSQVIDVSSSRNAAGRWFLIYETDEEKFVFLVFQPSRRLREAMEKFLHSRIKGMES